MATKKKLAWRMSTHAYLMLLLVSIFAVFSGLLYYFFESRLGDARRQALAQTQLFSDVAARALDSFHVGALIHAKAVSENPEALAAMSGGSCPAWLIREAAGRSYANIFLYAPDGSLACSAFPPATRMAPAAPSLESLKSSERGHIGSFYKDGDSWVFPASYPATRGAAAAGAVTFLIRSDKMDLMRDALMDRGAEVFFVDQERTVGLARVSSSNMRSGAIASPALRTALDAGLAGHSKVLSDESFAAASNAVVSGWSVAVRLKPADVYSPLIDGIAHQTIYLGSLCFLAMLVIWGLATRLSAATKVLVNAAGNLETLFSSRWTGVSEIDQGIAQLRRSSREQAKAQAAVELWRSAGERTRSGMAILRRGKISGAEPSLHIEICNPAFESLSGMGPCAERDILSLPPPMSALGDKATLAEMRACAIQGGPASRSCTGLNFDGLPIHIQMSLEPISLEDSPEGSFFCMTLEDVTQISEREAQLERQSTTDSLTGLPNRALFISLLAKSIALSERNKTLCAVALFDVDHFKFINDSIGRDNGDKVIAMVAERLAAKLRPGDTLSRFGGDEFGVVLADVESQESLASLVEHARDALNEPFEMAGQSFQLTFSAGAAVHPEDGSDPKALLSAADIAMFQAKANGRGNVKFHSKVMSASFAERLAIEHALKIAIQDGSIEFLYQPKVSVQTGQPCGMEALARWIHPVLGTISPTKFIPLAEESDLIASLGSLAIGSALRDARSLWDLGFRNMPVAINVSARQIKDGFAQQIAAALLESGLPSSSVHVEITESSVMPDTQSARDFLAELERLDIKVALDDFGTGWSNMAMLKTLPLSYLKMDRSFVVGLGKDPKDAAIAKAIVSLARALGVEVIAEGVETQMQAQQLGYLQVDQLQGYYVCKPLTIKELAAWLHSGYAFQGSRPAGSPT